MYTEKKFDTALDLRGAPGRLRDPESRAGRSRHLGIVELVQRAVTL